jgi:Ca2+-binding EF-hand superfamily protein
MDALKVIDKEKKQGFISTKQIRFWMISNGENLTEEETTQLIKEGDPNNTGNIRFNDLVRRLT